jgi:hypothetical protein
LRFIRGYATPFHTVVFWLILQVEQAMIQHVYKIRIDGALPIRNYCPVQMFVVVTMGDVLLANISLV